MTYEIRIELRQHYFGALMVATLVRRLAPDALDTFGPDYAEQVHNTVNEAMEWADAMVERRTGTRTRHRRLNRPVSCPGATHRRFAHPPRHWDG